MLGGGVGSLMGDVHRLSLRLAGGYDLVAGCFSNIEAENWETATSLGIDRARVYSDEHALVEAETGREDGVEAVIILTPNHLHAVQARACLNAGLDVICEKPLSRTLDEARSLVALAESVNRVLVVTHTYTGYPMVRRAREIVRAGDLGEVWVVQVEYPQDWLATPLEATGHRQAIWRTDPTQAGAGCVGDIGTHAFNLAEFVTGLDVEMVACDLSTAVVGRQVDDNVNVLLRFENGATGMIWASQVAHGHGNDLRIRVYGSEGSLDWAFRQARSLSVFMANGTRTVLVEEAITMATETDDGSPPSGNPRHYFEAFAHLYRDIAEEIRARNGGSDACNSARLLQMAPEGARAVAFVDACLASAASNSAWTMISPFGPDEDATADAGVPDLFAGDVQAVIFDLDGVITDTASVHFAAWKALFDGFLQACADERGEPFLPFDEQAYLLYVDGKPRYEGVRSMLESRGVNLPLGTAADDPGAATVCGLGNRKNALFLDALAEEGAQVFQTSVDLLHRLHEAGVRTGCVSSSKNCRFVLESVGLLEEFDAILDGNDAVDRGLSGKPAPDTYLDCALQMSVEPGAAAMVEDALSGVASGAAGGFRHVIGVDRGAGTEALIAAGATVVVDDLGALLGTNDGSTH